MLQQLQISRPTMGNRLVQMVVQAQSSHRKGRGEGRGSFSVNCVQNSKSHYSFMYCCFDRSFQPRVQSQNQNSLALLSHGTCHHLVTLTYTSLSSTSLSTTTRTNVSFSSSSFKDPPLQAPMCPPPPYLSPYLRILLVLRHLPIQPGIWTVVRPLMKVNTSHNTKWIWS